MTPQWIESDANPKVKRWKRLCHDARFLRREGSTLLEGDHLLASALEALGRGEAPEIPAVMVSDAAAGPVRALALKTAECFHSGLFLLPARLYDEFSPVEHGIGLAAEMKIPPSGELCRDADILYLDGIQDAGNAGTLIRTAVAAGFRTIAAGPRTAGLWTPKAVRSGMGAHFGAKLIENVAPEALKAHFDGLIAAADARGGEDLFRSGPFAGGAVCWVMGAEGPGVSEAALAVADRRFLIPIAPECESLNVGAAAAVCLFETRRRRLLGVF